MLQNLDEPPQQRRATQSGPLLLPGQPLLLGLPTGGAACLAERSARKALKSFGLLRMGITGSSGVVSSCLDCFQSEHVRPLTLPSPSVEPDENTSGGDDDANNVDPTGDARKAQLHRCATKRHQQTHEYGHATEDPFQPRYRAPEKLCFAIGPLVRRFPNFPVQARVATALPLIPRVARTRSQPSFLACSRKSDACSFLKS